MRKPARATLQIVAERAGVSRQTVSNVVNSPHLVRPQTLSRVQRVLDELDYRPHLAARQMRTQRSQLIGLRLEPVRDGVNGVVLDRFLHALSENAQARGYRILLFTADDVAAEIRSYQELTMSHEIDAFVLTSTHHGDARTEWLGQRGVPFVTFGRPWGAEDQHDWVDVDGARGTSEAVEHLHGLGHQRIAFIGWPTGSGVGDDRRAGWRRAMNARALATEGLDWATSDGIDSGAAAATGLLERPSPPTAFVCASDSLAIGALGVVRARGLMAGDDVAVVGFDDTALAQGLGLSSVSQPIDAVASGCLHMLQQRLQAKATRPAAPPSEPHQLLAPTLRVRASSHRSTHPSNPPDPLVRPPQGAHA